MLEEENFIHTKYGYCYYIVSSTKTPFIWNLYIEPEYRRKGHARKILQYVIDEIKNTGYTGEIEIEAIPRENSIDSLNLIRFYISMGLRVI